MLSWGFELLQAVTVSFVLFRRNLANLLKEILLAFGYEQNLILPQIS